SIMQPSSCKVLLCCWVLSTVFILRSGAPSLRGQKVVLFGRQCSYWELRGSVSLPALDEFTVCVDLCRKINTRQWTAFTYNRPPQRLSEGAPELGLAGHGQALRLWLFGRALDAPVDLRPFAWHSVCLAWSGVEQKVWLYVNGSGVFSAAVPDRRPLAPHGTLTLGVAHGLIGGEIVTEDGNNLIGEIYFFRMWDKQRSAQQVSSQICAEGNVIRWTSEYWHNHSCSPVPDLSLPCASSFYSINMSIYIMRRDGQSADETIAKDLVCLWLTTYFPANITVLAIAVFSLQQGWEITFPKMQIVITAPASYGCFVSVKVIPSSEVLLTKEEVTRLLRGSVAHVADSCCVVLPLHLLLCSCVLTASRPSTPTTQDTTMSVSTAVMSTSTPVCGAQKWTSVCVKVENTKQSEAKASHFTAEAKVQKGFKLTFYTVSLNATLKDSSDNPEPFIYEWLLKILPGDEMTAFNLNASLAPVRQTRFQLQVNSTANVNDTKTQIEHLLQKNYTNGTGSVEPEPNSINVYPIEPGRCPEQTQLMHQGQYLWPETQARFTAKLQCERDPENQATRNCMVNALTNRAQWDKPDLMSCPTLHKTIADLSNITVTANNSEDLAELIKNLTSDQLFLSHNELIIVFSKMAEILDAGSVTPPLGQTIIDILNKLLGTESNLQPFTNDILNVMESLGNRIAFPGNLFSLTSPNLALSVVGVDPRNFSGLAFGVSSFSQGVNPQLFLQVFINQGPSSHTIAFISLPSALENHFPQHTELARSRVQFQFYGKTELFQDSMKEKSLLTYVISGSVTNATIRNLRDPVTVTLHHLKPNRLGQQVQCVFWDLQKNGGQGGWSPEGCEVYGTSVNHTTCVCDHLTHFGVLLVPSRSPVNSVDNRILTLITYVGCGLSALFLGISLLTYTAFEKLRRDYPSKILMNLSAALLGLNLVFLVDSWLASFNRRGLCISVAVILHYFLLASFTWMGLEAVHMYFALVKVFNIYVPCYILKFCSAGWGIPLLVIALVLAINKDAYGSGLYAKSLSPSEDSEELFCWVQSDVAFYVSVVAFFLLVLLCNVAVFVVVLLQIRNVKAKQPAGCRGGLLHDLKSVASITFLLGLTWALAFLAWGPARVPLLYLFSIFNSLQGFFIFVFHCLMKDSVRKQWRIHLCCGRFRLATTSEWSQSGTKSREKQLAHSPSVKSAKSDKSNSTSSTSNESDSGGRLVSTPDLVYENTLTVPQAHSPSFHDVLRVGPREMEGTYQVCSWLPRERSY
uniref:Adhesion G-protein coupled receptor G2 n=1 Tax=Lepisosteus oculatus TaxID=7918 RepID=W5ND92_LEPOC